MKTLGLDGQRPMAYADEQITSTLRRQTTQVVSRIDINVEPDALGGWRATVNAVGGGTMVRKRSR
jgi:hypothetical protein